MLYIIIIYKYLFFTYLKYDMGNPCTTICLYFNLYILNTPKNTYFNSARARAHAHTEIINII